MPVETNVRRLNSDDGDAGKKRNLYEGGGPFVRGTLSRLFE